MTSTDSAFDLESLLDDAQDLADESFIARALLQPETNPWESFPLALLYPTQDYLNETHHSFLVGSAANSMAAIEPTIKSEPVEDVDLLSSVSQPQCDFEIAEYLKFTHEDLTIASPTTTVLSSSSPIEESDAPLLYSDQGPAELRFSYFKEQLKYPCATISSSSSTTECAPLLQLDDHAYFTDHLYDTITASATADSSSISVADTCSTTTISSTSLSFSPFSGSSASPPTPIASPSSSSLSAPCASITIPPTSSPELSSSGPPDSNAEDLHLSHVALNEGKHASPHAVNHDEPQLEEPEVHYTFVDQHEKPRKRRAKGVKNSTRIACTFCRRRKIRCGGPQEGGGVCKSCIRLNHKGDCVFPAVSYRGQRLGGSGSSAKRKATSKSKGIAKCTPSSEST